MRVDRGQQGQAAGGAAPDQAGLDPVSLAITHLKAIDRAMAQVLRAVADVSTVEGMAGERLISLATSGTSWDLKLLRRITQTLTAMPLTWAAFDNGLLSWGQLRSIALSARDLSVADRHLLDAQLTAAIAQNATAEPDRLCDLAGDLAQRLQDQRLADRETATMRRSGLRFTPTLFGGTDIHGHLDDTIAESVVAAVLDAAPTPRPVPPVDDDGRTVPGSWARPDSLAHRMAIGLARLARTHLNPPDPTNNGLNGGDGRDGGDGVQVTTRRPGTLAHVVVDLATLTGEDDTIDSATARLLWRLAGGRRTLSRARAAFMSCDALKVPVLTDGDRVLAVGDAHDPIPLAVRRAAAVRDQGCRFPGCDRPQADTDLHHVIFRSQGGPTLLGNLISLCEHCHNLVHKNGWHLTLDPDGVLTVRHGRWRFTSRPRLRPPPPRHAPPPHASPDPPPVDHPAVHDTDDHIWGLPPIPF